MATVQDTRTRIRDFIQHPRQLSPLLADKPNWNMLASSFDTVADTEMAIETYQAMPYSGDTGMRYLGIYGILQCLYVRQDTVQSVVRAFEPNAEHSYRIESEPEADEVRQIRYRAIGHPTREGSTKSTKRPGVQMSHFIVQHWLNKDGFTLMTTFATGMPRFATVSIPELIQNDRQVVERVLTRIMIRLETDEMEHRQTFRDEARIH